MQGKDCRIVYMGTPGFAVSPLQYLVEQGYNVVAVVTVPDKPAGRGQQLHQSDVKRYAVEQNLPVLQPEKLKNTEFLTSLKAFAADIFIVVAFRMLPKEVWQMPALGTFNLHASLLPQYRGAAPINWAVINGETESGITTFLIDEQIDTGNILLQEKVQISPDETAGELHDELMLKGAKLVAKTVDMLAQGNITPTVQSAMAESVLKGAPKLFKETCRVDWNKPASVIHNQIRGLSPYPAAWTMFVPNDNGEGFQMKIIRSVFEEASHNYEAGHIVTDGKSYLNVAVPDGFVSLLEIQPQSKRKMSISDFLRGFREINRYKVV